MRRKDVSSDNAIDVQHFAHIKKLVLKEDCSKAGRYQRKALNM